MKKILLSFCLIMGMALPILAQNTGSISGTVKSDSGDPVIGASVLLLNATGVFVKGVAVDANGKYSLDGIASGSYIFKVTSIGYADYSTEVEVKKGDQLTVDANLIESAISLDDITITAGRKAEKISEAAANIQVIDAHTLQISKEPTAFGLMKNMNGIDYVESGLGQQQVNARGFASIFTGGMLTLVDYRDVSLPGIGGVFGPTMAVAPQDIKQMEVIVGPNSALYGSGAGQGVINIITKSPKENAGHSFTLKGGNQNQFGFGFRSSSMLSNKFGYKISGDYSKAKDFSQSAYVNQDKPTATPIYTNPNLNIGNITGNGALYYFPSDNTEISASAGITQANYVNQSNIGQLQIKDFTYWYYQMRANFNKFLGKGSAFVQAYYVADDAKKTYNLENVAVATAAGMSESDAIAKYTFVDKPKRFVAEFQHNLPFSEKHSLTYGANFRDSKPNSGGTFLDDGPTGIKIDVKEFGSYAQYENKMVKNLSVTATGRYDNNSQFGSRFTPKVGLSYKVAGVHNLRAIYNQAFAAPPLQPAYANSPITTLVTGPPAAPFPSQPVNMVLRGAYKGFDILDKNGAVVDHIAKLKPSITKSIEFGYKGLWLKKLYVDLTYFNTTYTDFLSSPIPINNPELILNGPAGPIPTGQGWKDLVYKTSGTPISYVDGRSNELVLSYVNFGKVNIQGINAAVDYAILPSLNFKLAYTWTQYGKFKEVPPTITSTGSPNSPTHVAKGGISYNGKNGLILDFSGRYVESYNFFGARVYNRGTIPTYTVFDFKGEYPIFSGGKTKTSVGFNLKNVFDNRHIELPGTATLGFLALGYVRVDIAGH